jgi:hypothetical protein
MAESNANAGLLVGGTAAIVAAIALARQRPVMAPGVMALDKGTQELLIAMAATQAEISEKLGAITGSISSDNPSQVTVQGYPANTATMRAVRVACAVAGQAYQLPDLAVPEGFGLVIKGWFANGGLIYIGDSAATCTNANSIYPLLANETVTYFVKQANELWISSTVGGESCVMTCEQRRGGI